MGGTQSSEENDTPQKRREEISENQPQNEQIVTSRRTRSRSSPRPLQQQQEMEDNSELEDDDSQSSQYAPSAGFQQSDEDEDNIDDEDDEEFVLAEENLDSSQETFVKTLYDSETSEGRFTKPNVNSSPQGRTSPAGSESSEGLRTVANPSETGSGCSSVSTVSSSHDSHLHGRFMGRAMQPGLATVNNPSSDSVSSGASQPSARGISRMVHSASATMNNPVHDSVPTVQSRDDSCLYERYFPGMMSPEMAAVHHEGLSRGRQGNIPAWARNSNVPEGQSDTGSQKEEVTQRYLEDRGRSRRYREEEEIRESPEYPQPYFPRQPSLHREVMPGRTFGGESNLIRPLYISDDSRIPRGYFSERSLPKQQQGLPHTPLYSSSQDLGRAGLRQHGAFQPLHSQPSARPLASSPHMMEAYPGRHNPHRSQAYPHGHNAFRSLSEPYARGQNVGLSRPLSSGSEPVQPTCLRTSSSSDVDELFETLCEPYSAEVLVKGVSRKTSRETLRMYFTNSTRSEGGPVSNLRLDKTTGRCHVSFESAEVARNVVSKQQHVVDEKNITVTFDQSAGVPSSSQRTVAVQNFEMTTTTEELLRTYFEDPSRGGGEVTHVTINRTGRGFATVRFQNEEDARHVMTKEHVLNWKPLRVCLYEEPYALSSVFCLGGLRVGQRMGKDLAEDLVHFVEGQTQCPVYDIFFGSKSVAEGTALVIFEDDLHLLDLQRDLAATDFHGHKLSVRSVPVSRTVQVHNLPLSSSLGEDTLTNYFQNTRQSGGQNVLEVVISRYRDHALVTFADPEVCRNVVNRSQVLHRVQLNVQTYFDCVGTKFEE